MKSKLLTLITTIGLVTFTGILSAQPNLGTCSQFELFTSSGAVSNTGISQVTGNVGTNGGSSTGFGNVNGVMHDNDGASAAAAADLTLAYNQLNATVPTFFPAPLLGNGQVLNAGVYYIATPATLNLGLTLDGQGNPSAVFIFQIDGAFSTNALSHVNLVNGALACNVFWMVEGLVSMGPGCAMRGTIVANNAAINMSTGDTLEGRALSTAGAITIDGVLAYTPIGCNSPVLMGPIAPNLASAECYAIFSSDGPVTNVGVTNVVGDVGTNNGSVTGFNPLLVIGAIHAVPDGSTAACSADLLNAYNYTNLLSNDIELLYPAQFGNNLVLTPHTYVMLSACTFTDTLFLNAENSPNAVFVIKIYGALTTSTYSKVRLINGAQAKNVYWMVDGAVSINDYSIFQGTIICNNGAMNLATNMTIYGRALTTTGALGTAAITAIVPPGCGNLPAQITTPPVNQVACVGDSVSFTVSASGTGITYQWRRGNINLVNAGNISGVTTATLTIDPVTLLDAATDYNVIIGGPFGPTDTSSNVSLTVNIPPVITAQPVNQISCSGDSVSFTVSASGSNLTYQWRKGLVNLINSGNISGVNSPTLTFNPVSVPDAGIDYNVIVSGSCAPPDTSIDVSLVVNAAIAITSQPISQIACVGDSISFSVTATGNGLLYQWRKGNINLINAGNISGVTTSVLTIDPVTLLDGAVNYNVIVSGTGCSGDTSLNVSLTVNAPPSITSQPVNQITCEGDAVSFSVVASGSSLTYQWRKGSVNLINSGNISGANSPTLTINPVTVLDAALNYNVIVSGSCTPPDTSVNASLVVNSAILITSQPVNQIACPGDSISFSVTATGTGLLYQWRKGNINLINAGNISGVTTSVLTIDPVTIFDAALDYNVIVTGTGCTGDTSANASLTVNALAIIIQQPADQTVCEGSSASFTVGATGSGLTYQWRKGVVNLVNAGNISGVTSATLTINPANQSDAATDYNVVINGTCAPAVTSNNVTLAVDSAPNAIATSNSPVCTDSSIYLYAQTAPGGTYSWTGPNSFSSTDQNPIIGSATNAYTGTYTLIVTGNGCTAQSTAAVTVATCPDTDFHIPNGFSPNGDGTNDLFVIRGILNFPENTFMVYNRWGNLVFQASPYQNTWDGRSAEGISVGGDQLPVGIYFYVLDLGNETPVYKGTIYLNR